MKTITKNLLVLLASDGASRLLGFLATAIIARSLAIEGFGLISYGLAFLNYAILLANPGLTVIGAREIARDLKNRTIIEELQGLRIVLMLIVLLVFALGLLLFHGSAQVKHIIMLYLITLIPFSFQLEYVFQGRQEIGLVGLARFIQSFSYLASVYGLLKIMDSLGVPVAFAFGYLVGSGLLLIVYLRKYQRLPVRFSLRRWRLIMKSALPVGLATIFNQAMLNLPIIILGIMSTQIEVGAFSAAYKIILMLLIFERVFHYALFPFIARQYRENPAALTNSFELLTKVMSVLTSAIVAFGIVFAKEIVTFIYGAGYGPSIVVLQILLFYFLISPLNSIYGYGLVALENEKKFMRVTMFTAVLSALLMTMLAALMQSRGAALALVAGEILSIVLMSRGLLKLRKFNVWNCLRGPVIALAGAASIGLWLRSMPSLSRFAIAILVYLSVIVISGHFSKHDRIRLMRSLRDKSEGLP